MNSIVLWALGRETRSLQIYSKICSCKVETHLIRQWADEHQPHKTCRTLVSITTQDQRQRKYSQERKNERTNKEVHTGTRYYSLWTISWRTTLLFCLYLWVNLLLCLEYIDSSCWSHWYNWNCKIWWQDRVFHSDEKIMSSCRCGTSFT